MHRLLCKSGADGTSQFHFGAVKALLGFADQTGDGQPARIISCRRPKLAAKETAGRPGVLGLPDDSP